MHPEDRDVYVQAMAEYRANSGLAFRMEFRVRNRKEYGWIELRATMLGKSRSSSSRCLGLIADITSRKAVELLQVTPVHQDSLTGLGNRLALLEHAP